MEQKNAASHLFRISLAVFAIWLCFEYALPVALPFLAALFISAAARGAAERLLFGARRGKRLLSLVFGVLFFAAPTK